MNELQEQELMELESESELSHEVEGEGEGEGEFGALLSGLLGQGEGEGEGEGELGAIIGSLLGEGEGEGEFEGESELESEFEMEGELEGEQFFGKAFRSIGSFVKRAAPILKNVAKVAAPLVGTAIGGPIGGMLGKAAASALGEGELHELEGEFEMEGEFEGELEFARPCNQLEAMAELMGEGAAQAETEGEAEAMVGASTATYLSRPERAALRGVARNLVNGARVLTRILRRRRTTRPAVRAVPTIVNSTIRTLAKRAARGQPVTRRTAARVMAAQTRRILGNPRACATAIRNNMRASRIAARPRRRTA